MRAPSAVLLGLALGWGACATHVSLEETSLARAGAFAEGVERARLVADIDALVAAHAEDTPLPCDLFEPGTDSTRRPVCHLTRDRARELVRARLESLGLRVTTHQVDDPRFPTTNLIAEIPGTELPGEVVLVGAHYDSFFLGADDNSSGVAAMLELARLAAGQRFRRTVRFIGFDLEELGLVGSTRYVRAFPDERIVASLVFDCVGYRSQEPGSQKGLPGFPLPPRGDFLAAIANEASRPQVEELKLLGARLQHVPVVAIVTPQEGSGPASGNLMRSDHAPFWLTGQNALFLTDTANFRNPHYHLASDLPDTLDPDFLTGVTRLSAAGIAYWAEGPLP
ncbi:M28 family peptidase [Melittangium boletus]|uniref:M28 family peptidase n=1 Tax=Melittangium boletus TaxID=83453 RepID=UPI003DA29451